MLFNDTLHTQYSLNEHKLLLLTRNALSFHPVVSLLMHCFRSKVLMPQLKQLMVSDLSFHTSPALFPPGMAEAAVRCSADEVCWSAMRACTSQQGAHG